MLLLLIWRHLGVYGADDRPVDVQNLNMSVRFIPSFDVHNFRSEVGRKLGPLLHRMSNMVSTKTVEKGFALMILSTVLGPGDTGARMAFV